MTEPNFRDRLRFRFSVDEAKEYFDYRIGTDFQVKRLIMPKVCRPCLLWRLESIPSDETNKFDCVITFSVLEHVYNPNTFIEEINNFMAPKGRLVVSTHFIECGTKY